MGKRMESVCNKMKLLGYNHGYIGKEFEIHIKNSISSDINRDNYIIRTAATRGADNIKIIGRGNDIIQVTGHGFVPNFVSLLTLDNRKEVLRIGNDVSKEVKWFVYVNDKLKKVDYVHVAENETFILDGKRVSLYVNDKECKEVTIDEKFEVYKIKCCHVDYREYYLYNEVEQGILVDLNSSTVKKEIFNSIIERATDTMIRNEYKLSQDCFVDILNSRW